MDRVTEIINFWFGNPDRSVGKPRSVWFKSDPNVDRIIQEKFTDTELTFLARPDAFRG